jgi:hypothetical protein
MKLNWIQKKGEGEGETSQGSLEELPEGWTHLHRNLHSLNWAWEGEKSMAN